MSSEQRAVMKKVRAGFYTLEHKGRILMLCKEHDFNGYIYWSITEYNCSGGQTARTLRAAEVIGRRFFGDYT